MKIQIAPSNHLYTFINPFSRLFKIKGIVSGQPIPFQINVTNAKIVLRTPRRIHCGLQLSFLVGPHDYYPQAPGDIQVYWRHKRHSIPETSFNQTMNMMIKIPEDYPAVRQLKKAQPKIHIDRRETLTNRLAIKCRLQVDLYYLPRITHVI